MAFVNLQRLLSLNKDKGEAMARDDIAKNDLTRGAELSIGYLGGGAHNESEAQSRMLQAQERAKTLAGGAARTNGLDAALSGGSAAMQQYQQRTNNLSKLMAGAQQAQTARQGARTSDEQYRRDIAAADERAKPRESAIERAIRLQREQRAKGGYNPKGGDEYAAYSDWIQTGRR